VKQFSKAIASCSIQLSESDINRLVARFDEEDNAMLNIAMFMQFIHGGKSETQAPTQSLKPQFNAQALSPAPASDLIAWDSFRERVEDRLFSGFSEAETYAVFCNSGGSIDLASLHSGARELGLAHMTRAEVRSILRRMCLNVGAILDSDSFLKSLGLRSNDYKGNVIKAAGKSVKIDDSDGLRRILISIKKDLEASYRGKDIEIVLEKALNLIDIDNDGAVTLREFSK
jgi:hypothetical protein